MQQVPSSGQLAASGGTLRPGMSLDAPRVPVFSPQSEALVPVVSALVAFIVCLAVAGALWFRGTLGARASKRAVDAAPANGEVGVAT